MIYVKVSKSVQLPGESVPTTAENVQYQSKDATVSDAHPYWKAFADGFVEGFTFPFAALFGMAGCSNNFPLPATNDGAPCDTSVDAGAHDMGSDVDAADVPADVTAAQDAALDASDDAADSCEEFCDADLVDVEEVALPDAVTEDIADIEDVPADIPEDATLIDAAEDVDLPDATTSDVAEDADAVMCQDFCDAGVDATLDVGLPQDVTSTSNIWGPTPDGQVFCTSDDPLYNTLLPASGQTYFTSMCTYLDTVEVFSIVKDAQGKKQVIDNIVPLTVDLFNVDFNNAADVALKKGTSIFAKFNALVPTTSLLPLEPQFASGKDEIEFKLAPDADLTWDATWLAVDSLGHEVSAKYNPADPISGVQAYLSVSYVKGQGLFAVYTFPCVFPKPYPPEGLATCPQKAVQP